MMPKKVIPLLCALVATVPAAVAGEEPSAIPDLLSACSQCHSQSGQAALPGWPPLRDMDTKEIIGKLKGHRDLIVPDSMMSKVAFELTDQQIEEIAEYYSNQEDPSQQPIRLLEQ